MNHVALFRGINVGGKNIVKMADLKGLFAGLGFFNVQTYIQSGNVVFGADGEPAAVAEKIREGFRAAFGFDSAVTLRTEAGLAAIVSGLPFSPAALAEAEAANPAVEHLYVYLLDAAPDAAAIERLTAGYEGPDRACAGAREVYLLCHQSIRDAKLVAPLVRLFPSATARNWKTINKLCEMIKK